MSKDERKFADVVKSIASSEEDVDKVLDAARLIRHEGENRKMSAEQKVGLIEMGLCVAILLGLLGFILSMFIITR